MMSTVDPELIERRLTAQRFRSYRAACGGDAVRALELYDWNARLSAAFLEDLGRLEVVFRNAVDERVVALAAAKGWPDPWYRDNVHIFPGRAAREARNVVETARRRASRSGRLEVHGKVIAEIGFGFWRFLCGTPYLTSLWVPEGGIAEAFPGHPTGVAGEVRADVEQHMDELHKLRNRVAHHEPIHHRSTLQQDHDRLLDLTGWVCPETREWVAARSSVRSLLADCPTPRA